MSRPEGLPPLFLERLRRIVPEDRFETVRASFSSPPPATFRRNRLAPRPGPSDEELAAVPATPLSWFPDGYVAPSEARKRVSSWMHDGHVWMQNPSSMLPPLVLAPSGDGEILDLAAAPGSKTLQLAGMVGDPGRIAAVELVRERFYRLKRNLKAQHASAVRTFNRDGTKVWRYRPDHFGHVLLDAPCSTEGRFREDDPETWRYWSPRKIRAMARKQRRLLESAVRATRVGGVVVYATCSFAPEENESVVTHALRTFEGALTVEPIEVGPDGMAEGLAEWDGEQFDPSLRHARRLVPDGVYEAFFVCRLRKVGPTPPPGRANQPFG